MSTQIIDAAETNETPPQVLQPPKTFSQPPPNHALAPPAPSPFFLGAGLEVVGNISCESDVQIDGVLKGSVEGRLLMVGEYGSVEGPVKVDDALIDGTIQGNIKAKGDVLISGTVIGDVAAHTVCLTPSARVFGIIKHEIVAIENGAIIEGRLRRRQSARRSAESGVRPRSGVFSRQQEPRRIIEKFRPMMGDRRAMARESSRRQPALPAAPARSPRRARSSGMAAIFGVLIAAAVLVGGVLMWPTIVLSQ